MCELKMHDALIILAERGRVRECDVDILQAEVFPDGLRCRADAEMLLGVDLAAFETCDVWQDYLVSAITDFAIRDSIVSQSDADWLTSCISRFGVVDGEKRFELLFTVIAYARQVPGSLTELALNQVVYAAFEGEGPLASHHCGQIGGVNEREVSLIRELLVASENEHRAALSLEEMAFLHSVNERSLPHLNHPSWNDLFTKAAANFVLSSKADFSQSRSFALTPATANIAADVKQTCQGTLEALERVGETCGGSEDMIRVVSRYKQKGLEDECPDEAELLGACLYRLQSMIGQAKTHKTATH